MSLRHLRTLSMYDTYIPVPVYTHTPCPVHTTVYNTRLTTRTGDCQPSAETQTAAVAAAAAAQILPDLTRPGMVAGRDQTARHFSSLTATAVAQSSQGPTSPSTNDMNPVTTVILICVFAPTCTSFLLLLVI